MKKLKLFMFVARFGAMSLGAFSAYDYAIMNSDEKLLPENIEAIASDESIGVRVDCSGSGSVYYPIDNRSTYKKVTYIQL